MATVRTPRTDYIPPLTDTDTPITTVVTEKLRRVSWGAILAGLAISLVVMIALNMLGLAIGAATVNPVVERDPIEPALGVGALIWLVASNLLALFAGGFVAGRLAGIPDDMDGVLHGLVTWAVVTLITLIFLTTSIGNVISGVTGAVSSGLSAIGGGIAELSPEVAEALDLQGSTLAGIGTEVRGLLSASNDATQTTTGDQTTEGASPANPTGAAQTTNGQDAAPTLAEIELNRSIRDFLTTGEVTDEDRSNLVTLISERTGISQEEAQATVDRWESTYRSLATEVEETARDVGQAVADGISALAGVVFVGMLIGAFAAGAGGLVGSPDTRLVKATTTVVNS